MRDRGQNVVEQSETLSHAEALLLAMEVDGFALHQLEPPDEANPPAATPASSRRAMCGCVRRARIFAFALEALGRGAPEQRQVQQLHRHFAAVAPVDGVVAPPHRVPPPPCPSGEGPACRRPGAGRPGRAARQRAPARPGSVRCRSSRRAPASAPATRPPAGRRHAGLPAALRARPPAGPAARRAARSGAASFCASTAGCMRGAVSSRRVERAVQQQAAPFSHWRCAVRSETFFSAAISAIEKPQKNFRSTTCARSGSIRASSSSASPMPSSTSGSAHDSAISVSSEVMSSPPPRFCAPRARTAVDHRSRASRAPRRPGTGRRRQRRARRVARCRGRPRAARSSCSSRPCGPERVAPHAARAGAARCRAR